MEIGAVIGLAAFGVMALIGVLVGIIAAVSAVSGMTAVSVQDYLCCEKRTGFPVFNGKTGLVLR